MSAVPQPLSIQDFLLAVDPGLSAEVRRHDDRTMTVVSLSRTETITRCGTCPKEETRPCAALRILALPHARHPAFRPEWRLAEQPDEVTGRIADAGPRAAEQARSARDPRDHHPRGPDAGAPDAPRHRASSPSGD